LIVSITLSSSCEQSETQDITEQLKPPEHVTVELIDGVINVHNKTIPYSEIDLVVDLILGDNENAGYYFGSPPKMVENREGNIFVGDYAENNIKKFDNEGNFLGVIGGKGQGPGEFGRGPAGISFYPDNRMLVGDNGYRYMIFDADGKYSSMLRSPGRSLPGYFIDLQGSLYRKTQARFMRKLTHNEVFSNIFPLIERLNDSFEVVGTIAKTKDFGNPYTNMMMNGFMCLFKENGDCYLGYPYQNLIELYKADTLFMSIDRELHFNAQTPESHYTEVKENSASMTFNGDLITQSMDIDSNGNLYLLTQVRGKKDPKYDKKKDVTRLLEVFDPNGWLIYCKPIIGIRPGRIFVGKGNKIYLNDLNEFTVIRYLPIIDI
jgi:hypothetical protein